MDSLAKKINDAIQRKAFGSIFRNDIETITRVRMEVDPRVREKLEAFARKHGWQVSISEAGIRATFKKMKG